MRRSGPLRLLRAILPRAATALPRGPELRLLRDHRDSQHGGSAWHGLRDPRGLEPDLNR